MNRKDLIKKIEFALDVDSVKLDPFTNAHISDFINALVAFESNASQEIFLKTFMVLKSSILGDLNKSDYIASENAIFGDFKDIRNLGFYKRYLHNVKLTKTYIKAYQLTEREYIETFGKSRYSSYDSFRIIKNRINQKK